MARTSASTATRSCSSSRTRIPSGRVSSARSRASSASGSSRRSFRSHRRSSDGFHESRPPRRHGRRHRGQGARQAGQGAAGAHGRRAGARREGERGQEAPAADAEAASGRHHRARELARPLERAPRVRPLRSAGPHRDQGARRRAQGARVQAVRRAARQGLGAMAKEAPKAAPKPQSGKPAAAAKARPRKGEGAPQGAAVAKGRPKGAGEVPPRLRVAFQQTVVPTLMKERGYTNPWQVPRVEKVVINMGVGEGRENAKVLDFATADLQSITGQKPIVTRARKSIANFKLREGVPIGAKVTLRGARMYEFLDRLINVALPRVRDFKGVPSKGFDGRGNYALGLREQVIFPEIVYDKVDKIRGMDVSIVTTARTDEDARALLVHLGMPFRE